MIAARDDRPAPDMRRMLFGCRPKQDSQARGPVDAAVPILIGLAKADTLAKKARR
ncbi:hypothetical protein PKB_4087 [Pseudomonas knackmussii B13]|uniref:Uncharacterized protein n=1 Tax=Pseudomonas knackmussii (strain DSM 6978 / CCUG 54928 / LMG 23759 / B13) TaxID=1301098 RepID=A0A024HKK6_PSEKB|nr:hypothetical protein PKB_4087 [Pseudomonas knackmussii B13]